MVFISWMVAFAALIVINLNTLGQNFSMSLIHSSPLFLMIRWWNLQLSIDGLTYHHMVSCSSHAYLFSGFSFVMIFVTGVANGIML